MCSLFHIWSKTWKHRGYSCHRRCIATRLAMKKKTKNYHGFTFWHTICRPCLIIQEELKEMLKILLCLNSEAFVMCQQINWIFRVLTLYSKGLPAFQGPACSSFSLPLDTGGAIHGWTVHDSALEASSAFSSKTIILVLLCICWGTGFWRPLFWLGAKRKILNFQNLNLKNLYQFRCPIRYTWTFPNQDYFLLI